MGSPKQLTLHDGETGAIVATRILVQYGFNGRGQKLYFIRAHGLPSAPRLSAAHYTRSDEPTASRTLPSIPHQSSRVERSPRHVRGGYHEITNRPLRINHSAHSQQAASRKLIPNPPNTPATSHTPKPTRTHPTLQRAHAQDVTIKLRQ